MGGNGRCLLSVRLRGEVGFKADRGIVIEDAAAALAEHQFLASSQILVELWPERNLARAAPAFRGFGNRYAVPLLANSFVSRVDLGLHSRDNRLALGFQFRE